MPKGGRNNLDAAQMNLKAVLRLCKSLVTVDRAGIKGISANRFYLFPSLLFPDSVFQYLLPALDDVRGEDGAPQGHASQAAGEDGAGGADVVLGLA